MELFSRSFIMTFAFIIISTASFAEIKTYEYTVKQPFGGSQAPDDARIAAVAKAKREVLELAGTYLESLTVVQDSMVKKDEILALAAGVLKAEIVSQENYHTEDAFGIIVIAKVDVDTSILEKRIERLLKDQEKLVLYEKLVKREKDLLKKIYALENMNRQLMRDWDEDPKKKEKLKRDFKQTTNQYSSFEEVKRRVDKILLLLERGDYKEAESIISDIDETALSEAEKSYILPLKQMVAYKTGAIKYDSIYTGRLVKCTYAYRSWSEYDFMVDNGKIINIEVGPQTYVVHNLKNELDAIKSFLVNGTHLEVFIKHRGQINEAQKIGKYK
jgi:hypothetical protein